MKLYNSLTINDVMYDKHRPSMLTGSRETQTKTQKVVTMASNSSVTVETSSLSVTQPLNILAVQTEDNTKDLSLTSVFLVKLQHTRIIRASHRGALLIGSMRGKYQTHVQLSG